MSNTTTSPPAAAPGSAILPITMSVRDAALAVGISRRQIYNYISAGELRPIKLGSRTLIFYDELRDWLLSRRTRPENPPSAA